MDHAVKNTSGISNGGRLEAATWSTSSNTGGTIGAGLRRYGRQPPAATSADKDSEPTTRGKRTIWFKGQGREGEGPARSLQRTEAATSAGPTGHDAAETCPESAFCGQMEGDIDRPGAILRAARPPA